jgi:predicted RNase H-like HicB family nuclease
MLTEYIEEALRRARYELIDDEEPYYGEVPELKGVWASGKTLEECRENLKDVIEGWILVSLRKDLPVPSLGAREIKELKIAAG